MRILHLSWEYPPVVYGGLGRHVHALAETQASLGHEVVVVTQAETGAGNSDEVVRGVRVLRVRPTAPGGVDWRQEFQRWAFGFNTAAAIAGLRLGRTWHPDVIHGHDWLVGQSGAILREALRAPFILTVHATESGRTGGRLETAQSSAIHESEAWSVAQADDVIVCSQAMRQEVGDLFGIDSRDLTVLPNGIDPARWQVPDGEARDETWLSGHPRVVFIGRLEEEKGVRTLLDAMVHVHADIPDARLLIVGEGGAGASLRAHAQAQGLTGDTVRFAGFVSEADLRRLGASADVAVVPSWYEPFGFVALEAAVLGAPLVVSETGGLSTIVADGRTGLVVPPADAGALARAIIATLLDPEAAAIRADRARADVAERFAWPTIAAGTEAVYRSAVARSSAGAQMPDH